MNYNEKRQVTIKLEELKEKLNAKPLSTGVNINFNTRQRILKLNELTKLQDSLERFIITNNKVSLYA